MSETSLAIDTVGAMAPTPVVASVRVRRLARRSRIANIGVVVIFLGMSVFAVWVSRITAAASTEAITASRLSYDYAQAATAIAAENGLALDYRLYPSPAVRAQFSAVAAELMQASGRVGAAGDAEDRAFVAQVLRGQPRYVAAVGRMFTAVDHHDATGC